MPGSGSVTTGLVGNFSSARKGSHRRAAMFRRARRERHRVRPRHTVPAIAIAQARRRRCKPSVSAVRGLDHRIDHFPHTAKARALGRRAQRVRTVLIRWSEPHGSPGRRRRMPAAVKIHRTPTTPFGFCRQRPRPGRQARPSSGRAGRCDPGLPTGFTSDGRNGGEDVISRIAHGWKVVAGLLQFLGIVSTGEPEAATHDGDRCIASQRQANRRSIEGDWRSPGKLFAAIHSWRSAHHDNQRQTTGTIRPSSLAVQHHPGAGHAHRQKQGRADQPGSSPASSGARDRYAHDSNAADQASHATARGGSSCPPDGTLKPLPSSPRSKTALSPRQQDRFAGQAGKSPLPRCMCPPRDSRRFPN